MKSNAKKRIQRLKSVMAKQRNDNSGVIDVYISLKDLNHLNQWVQAFKRIGVINYDYKFDVTWQETYKRFQNSEETLPMGLVLHKYYSTKQPSAMVVNFECREDLNKLSEDNI